LKKADEIYNDVVFISEKVVEITKVPDSPPSSPTSRNGGELDDETLAQNRLKMAQKLGSPNAKKKVAEKQYVTSIIASF